MAIQLMKLRNVPPDELAEIHALLEAANIDVYETGAGFWGTAVPALWLRDARRLAESRALLDAYAAERQARARSEYEALKAAGKARTFIDMAREGPLRYILCLAAAAALVYLSTVPFLGMLW